VCQLRATRREEEVGKGADAPNPARRGASDENDARGHGTESRRKLQRGRTRRK